MADSDVCRFCAISEGVPTDQVIDTPFAADKEFFAIASIGALVEGWSLIVPKNHSLSMKALYSTPSFRSFVEPVIAALQNKYGRLIGFEHGANHHGSLTSCGTDHAHLHLVPFRTSLFPLAVARKADWIECLPVDVNDVVGDNEYLLYSDIDPVRPWAETASKAHILKKPSSQFFRRIIAEQLGTPDAYDYRKFPFLQNSIQTRHHAAMVFTAGGDHVNAGR